MKIVVVNDKLEVLRNVAYKFKGPKTVGLEFSDASKFPGRLSLRLYFSFSVAGKRDYKMGYGDIKICRQANSVAKCFQ